MSILYIVIEAPKYIMKCNRIYACICAYEYTCVFFKMFCKNLR